MKILIIRFSSIGDIVMCSPVARCAKHQLNAEVHFITKKAFVSLIEYDPNVSKVWAFDENWEQLKSALKAENFDLIIDLHRNYRSKKLSKLLGVRSVRIDKLSLEKFLLIYLKINKLPNKHFSERALDTLRDFGVTNDHLGMSFHINQNLVLNERPAIYACLAIGTTHYTKNIPESLLIEIINNSTIPVALLGGKSEVELGTVLNNRFPDKTILLAGKTSLQESAAWIQGSQYFIGGDTGLFHIALALKKPTISIWGATIPEYGVFPYYGKAEIEHELHEVKLSCRPCSKHGSKSCPKQHFKCMNSHKTEDIMNSIKKMKKNIT